MIYSGKFGKNSLDAVIIDLDRRVTAAQGGGPLLDVFQHQSAVGVVYAKLGCRVEVDDVHDRGWLIW
jgi:hypothetical protein